MTSDEKITITLPTTSVRAPLGANEVYVRLADQNQPQERINALLGILSPDERDRAARFRFEKDRIHFIAARGMLRQFLGTLLQTSPERVGFEYSKYGKPSLAKEFESTHVKFNISHSGGLALFAFTLRRDLGVDIERIKQDFGTTEIAERFFSASEVKTLRTVREALQAEAFFNCWTRKEAYIKAIGEGLSCPLDKFDVTLAPGEPAKLLETRVEGLPASDWSMLSLNVGPGFKAAMVVEGHDWELK
jgi:4'-phosphopantetheinyl transferase